MRKRQDRKNRKTSHELLEKMCIRDSPNPWPTKAWASKTAAGTSVRATGAAMRATRATGTSARASGTAHSTSTGTWHKRHLLEHGMAMLVVIFSCL